MTTYGDDSDIGPIVLAIFLGSFILSLIIVLATSPANKTPEAKPETKQSVMQNKPEPKPVEKPTESKGDPCAYWRTMYFVNIGKAMQSYYYIQWQGCEADNAN